MPININIFNYNKLDIDLDLLIEKARSYSDFNQLIKNIDYKFLDFFSKIQSLQTFKNIILVGMGGAILNPSMFLNLPKKTHIKFFIHYSTDPEFFYKILNEIEIESTAVISISKSGNTIETYEITNSWIKIFSKNNLDISKHFHFIIGSDESQLSNLANIYGITLLEHENISGRYASFTNISLIPAYLAGLDLKKILDTRTKLINEILNNNYTNLTDSISFLIEQYESSRKSLVLMNYSPLLSPLVEWEAQIIAESTGKSKHGITPIQATGPIDQHSQAQLYLEGPDDKSFINYYIDNNKYPEFSNLANLTKSEYKAFNQAIINSNKPIIIITVDELNEETLTELIILEQFRTILFCCYYNMNPFNQPSVELIKKNILFDA